jgi:DNA invertase Pin-like site-specific DNA recombinase
MMTPILTPPVEGAGPSPRPIGGGVCAAIDGAAGRASPGIDAPASHGLKDRALQLGWSAHRVPILDEDLGKSGASAEGRLGFQRLVAEVSLAQVGIVLGLEMSRLARSCRDWHQLLEVCALFGDLDGGYDPASYNDRLLLGLKGTMSEAESHLLKQRMLAGQAGQGASRGELGLPVPMGYSRAAPPARW